MIPILLFPIVETALNRVLQLDAAAAPRLQALNNTSLAIQIKPFDKPIRFVVLEGKLCLENAETPPTVTISGEVSSFVEAHLNKDNVRAGLLQISGDIGAAQRWQQLFSDLQPDWEEKLSEYVGDIAAHQIGSVLRQLHAWGKSSSEHLLSSAVQFAQEERRWIVSAAELPHFYRDVDRLRDDAERLLTKARQKGIQL
jgi:ubiquinone biosynthesis protein UbiJ